MAQQLSRGQKRFQQIRAEEKRRAQEKSQGIVMDRRLSENQRQSILRRHLELTGRI